MPNGVKYSTTTPSGSLRRDNVALGVNGNLGPTANTGFYSMPTPASGKYIINKVAASGVPNFFAPQNDTELIQFARNEGATGADTGSAAAVLAWIATQPNLEAANFEYENIVTDGLIFNLDAGFVGSYPTINTTWYDLSGNSNNGTLTNGPTFNSGNNGSIVFDGVDDFVALGTQTVWNSSNTLTIAVWVKITGIGGAPDIGGIITNQTTGFDLQCIYAEVYSPDSSKVRITYGVTHPNPNAETYASSLENKNAWLYAVGTRYFDGTNTIIKMHTNGTLKQTSTMSGQQSQALNSWVLGRFYAGRAMIGNIAIVQVYNKVLSEAEILQNYNAQKGRFSSIVTDSLVMDLNAGNASSYPGTGTLWTDLSGQNNNATLVNGPTFSSSNGGVISFDGTNDSAQWASDGAITTNLNTWYNDTTRTLQMWINFSNLNQGLLQSITSLSFDEVQRGFAISNSRWALQSTSFSTIGNALSTNTWYFVTLLRTGVDSWTIYQGTTNLGNVTSDPGATVLGEDYQFQLMCNGYGNHKQGTVGQVLFYNKVLSAAEIENNYNATKGRFGL